MQDRYGIDWNGYAGAPFWRKPSINRRVFFRHLGAALGGYFLMPGRPMERVACAAVSPKATAKNCIFILLAGAPSHVDTFDLKEGPWTPASFEPETYGGVRFPRGLLPTLAGQMESLALVRSVRSWAAVHSLAQTWVQIGRNPASAMARISPHVGSVASLELRPHDADPVLPVFVSLNPSGGNPENGYLPPEHAPFYVSPAGTGLANTSHRDGATRLSTRYNLLLELDGDLRGSAPLGAGPAEMASWNAAARRLMYNPDVDRVFTFPVEERTRYGGTAFGNACITARNLLRARLGTRFIQITLGSWDHHVNIYAPNGGVNALGRQLDLGLGTLLADLKADGLLDETLIVAMGEFGRTVGNLNGQNGRDHFLQMSALFAGARIRGGRALGSTDDNGAMTAESGWHRDRDIRPEDIEATIYSALGIDWTTVRHDDPLGRGFEYVTFADRDLFGPVHELWG
ncbi:MAG TPA: DUF1501 domain-containing protein [Bryobacteraceae bacterium]|nr:DUF1501 domain-containing protein [Bryobacteraceae bacterium]